MRSDTPVTSWSGRSRVTAAPPRGAKSSDFHINPAPHTQVPPGVYDPMGYPIREWPQRTLCAHRIQGGIGLQGDLEPLGYIESFVLANTPQLKVLDRGIRIARKWFSRGSEAGNPNEPHSGKYLPPGVSARTTSCNGFNASNGYKESTGSNGHPASPVEDTQGRVRCGRTSGEGLPIRGIT